MLIVVLVFSIIANGHGYGKFGILKPNLCPPDRMLFGACRKTLLINHKLLTNPNFLF